MRSDYALRSQMDRVLDLLTPGNRLVMEVCLHTGLRVGDVLAIPRARVAAGRFVVRESKTGKARRVSLCPDLVRRILAAAGDSPWAFPGRDPLKHRTRQAVWADVKRAARAYRMPNNVTPHSARKTYAVDLLHKYGDIERVRRALNHSSIEVTMLYALADMGLQRGGRK